MKVVIAEKPSVGKELAKVFGADIKHDGYLEGNGYTFTWAFGHLLQLAPPESYGFSGWKKENLPMLPEQFNLSIRQIKDGNKTIDDPGVSRQLKVIRGLFNQATEIIVATDAGREGELIFRYIYQYLKCTKPFKRLWISSQTDDAIKTGFRNLKPGTDYDTLYYSANSRAEADWLIGLNATQALSIAAGNATVLSMGRVQTPTLAMICSRFNDNKNFRPENYYQVSITLTKDNKSFKAISHENYKSKIEAEGILNSVKDLAGGVVIDYEVKPVKEAPPLLHDLSSLQQEANKQFGYTADETLNIAQDLYESKLISYPRTGSRYIGSDVFAEIPQLIIALSGDPKFGRVAGTIQNNQLNQRSVNGNKVTDHHALLITNIKPGNLDEKRRTIYELVAGRMLESFSPNCLKELTKIIIESGSLFIAKGTVIQYLGWRAVFNYVEDNEGEEEATLLPKVEKGETLRIIKKELLEKVTKPKPLYNEATLLKAMETAGKEISDEELRHAMKDTGLGTPATRASIIETLIKRGYIKREKKNLLPTERGAAVYDLVKDKRIAQPELTGSWEKRLEEIRTGASVPEFKKEIKAYAQLITTELLEGGKALANFSQLGDNSKTIICPLCKKGKIKINSKAAGCTEYQSGCNFTVWKIIAQKSLTDNQLTTLIEKGRTGLIKGFKSKSGKPFDAALVLQENFTVGFEFPKK